MGSHMRHMQSRIWAAFACARAKAGVIDVKLANYSSDNVCALPIKSLRGFANGCRAFSSELSESLVSTSHVGPTKGIHSAVEDCGKTQIQEVDLNILIGEELNGISERIRHILRSEVGILGSAAAHFFQYGAEGKRIRSSALLLLASSLSSVVPQAEFYAPDFSPYNTFPQEPRRRQQRIAEITEMIHVATLLHDDVLDDAETRRGLNSVNVTFGNKTAILAGDFLLARASVALAALRNTEVVELLATVIEHLVTGEMMQSKCSNEERLSLDYYYQKTYFKTASLIANSGKAVALLGGHDQEVADLAHDYGYHLGMCFQLVDDVLDFVGSARKLGKPTFSDLNSGIATAPVLFASEEFDELIPLIHRKFKSSGDVELAASLVGKSEGIIRTKQEAEKHSMLAIKAVEKFPVAQTKNADLCREALKYLAQSIINRQC